MAVNWCFNEPWKTAVNNSIISYPTKPKPSYQAVADALRPVMPSARIPKFDWTEGEVFRAELWLLNDSPEPASAQIRAALLVDGKQAAAMVWETGVCGPNENKQGHCLQRRLPKAQTDYIILRLESEYGERVYRLCYHSKKTDSKGGSLNL